MALLLYININLLYYVLKMFLFCFCLVSLPCMAINVSVQQNSGFLPGIMLLTRCYYEYHRGTRLNAVKRFCICSL